MNSLKNTCTTFIEIHQLILCNIILYIDKIPPFLFFLLLLLIIITIVITIFVEPLRVKLQTS